MSTDQKCVEDVALTICERAGLGEIAERVSFGRRLSREDALALYGCRDLHALGSLANLVRERLHGDRAYFNRNIHVNYTNVCTNGCRFCAFSRKPGEPGGYVLMPEDVAARVAGAGEISEVHIVGGVDPSLPYSYYVELIRAAKSARPGVCVKAFTMVELANIAVQAGLSTEEAIAELKLAGLDSCPGGGCEILSDRIHRELFPAKTGPQVWLEMQATAHRCGLKTNATMLYGHIETIEERVDHLLKLRALQDETGGFQALIPLSFHPGNTSLSHLPQATGFDDLRNVAVARLVLDNFAHIKAFWVMLSPAIAQISLWYGADDVDGTVVEERISHEAGATTPRGLTMDALLGLIREAGRIPAERDTLYNVMRTWS